MVVDNRCNDIIEISGQKTEWQKPFLELPLKFTIGALSPSSVDLDNLVADLHLFALRITVVFRAFAIKPTNLVTR
jgi:hypothetical protein